ncbi:MAG: hypothetical protein AAF799_00430 [Myxococcota bacterium]
MLSVTVWIVASAGALLSSACDAAQAETLPPAEASIDARPTAPDPVAGPPTNLEPPSSDQAQLSGVIRECLPAGGYTYLRLELDDGAFPWVVTMAKSIEPGQRVAVESLGTKHDFHSNRLDRDFDELVFGIVRPLRDEN